MKKILCIIILGALATVSGYVAPVMWNAGNHLLAIGELLGLAIAAIAIVYTVCENRALGYPRPFASQIRTDREWARFVKQHISRAATIRAEQLLLSHLAPTQRKQYKRHKYFDVRVCHVSDDLAAPRAVTRTFRIMCRGGVSGNVFVLNEWGRPTVTYCYYPQKYCPLPDVYLAQATFLMSPEFLTVANSWS